MTKQRADTRLQYLIAVLVFGPFIMVSVLLFNNGFLITIISLVLLVIIFILIFRYLRTLRQVWFDNSFIYLKNLIGHEEETINLGDVHQLKEEIIDIIRLPGLGIRQYTLTYKSLTGIKIIKFYGSISDRPTSRLKKLLGQSKLILTR